MVILFTHSRVVPNLSSLKQKKTFIFVLIVFFSDVHFFSDVNVILDPADFNFMDK